MAPHIDVPEGKDVIDVFHKWHAKLDSENREIIFSVSTQYYLEEGQADLLDPEDETKWTKVLVLPFPKDNVVTEKGEMLVGASVPTFFDTEQLKKRFIPIDDFVQVVYKMVEQINADLENAMLLQQMEDNAEWSLL